MKRRFVPIILATLIIYGCHKAVVVHKPDKELKKPESSICDGRIPQTDTVGRNSGPELVLHKEKSVSIDEIVFSPEGNTLAWSDWNGKIRILSLKTGELLHLIQGDKSPVHAIAYSPDGKILSSGTYVGTIKFWSVATGRLRESQNFNSMIITTLAYSPDGKILAVGGTWTSDDGCVYYLSVESGKILHKYGTGFQVDRVIFSQEGNLFAFTSWNDPIQVLPLATGKIQYSIDGDDPIAFSPDGKYLASGSYEKNINIWSVTTGEHLISLRGHTNYSRSIAFSPDGTFLASGGNDRTVIIWSVATGKMLHLLKGHTDYVLSVAFSPDGKVLASGGLDGSIRFWNTVTGQLLVTLYQFDNYNWFVQNDQAQFDCSGCNHSGKNFGEKHIHWRVGNKLYPAEKFFCSYFHPGLLVDSLRQSQ